MCENPGNANMKSYWWDLSYFCWEVLGVDKVGDWVEGVGELFHILRKTQSLVLVRILRRVLARTILKNRREKGRSKKRLDSEMLIQILVLVPQTVIQIPPPQSQAQKVPKLLVIPRSPSKKLPLYPR